LYFIFFDYKIMSDLTESLPIQADKLTHYQPMWVNPDRIAQNLIKNIDQKSVNNHLEIINKYHLPDCNKPLSSILNYEPKDDEHYSFINYDENREPLHVEIEGIHYYVVGLYKRKNIKWLSWTNQETPILQKYYIVSSDWKCFCWNYKTINNEILRYTIVDIIVDTPEKRIHRELIEKNGWKDCPPLATLFSEEKNRYYEFCNYDKNWEPLHVEINGVHYYVVHDTRGGAYYKSYVVDSEGNCYWPYTWDFIKESIKDFEDIKNSEKTRENIKVGDAVTFISINWWTATIIVTKINGNIISGLYEQNIPCRCNRKDIIKVNPS